ncbi:hypothetical protein [Aquipseudomonas guryensis]|jgi:hypothetical protein|uniref:Uncharacterized protein n=1 Tax=Aquipseudomonas guryensis TaxID=2759165 RepID=A0A7W4DET1_9GAMM|nr:hypothetical protein [Pseudomonas guryensis]MBB1521269.1 hypothetical protein [Pseudomonas guryensis]
MNKPIDQRTPGSPSKTAAPTQKGGNSSTQPFYKANTLNKQDGNQGPAKDNRQAQQPLAKDPVKAPPRAAQGDDDLMSQEPKKS